jgi:hypothetical protein
MLGRRAGASRASRMRSRRASGTKSGKKAGPLRNQRMLDEGRPDLVVAFPGGGGTEDMRCAVKAGVSVHEVNRADDW